MPKKQSSTTKAKKKRAVDKENHEKAKSQIAAAQSTHSSYDPATSSSAPQLEHENDSRFFQSTDHELDPTTTSNTRHVAGKRKATDDELEPHAKRYALADTEHKATNAYKLDDNDECEHLSQHDIVHKSQISTVYKEGAKEADAMEFDNDECEQLSEHDIVHKSQISTVYKEGAKEADAMEFDNDECEQLSEHDIVHKSQISTVYKEGAKEADAMEFDNDECEQLSEHDIVLHSQISTVNEEGAESAHEHDDSLMLDDDNAFIEPPDYERLPFHHVRIQSDYQRDRKEWFNDVKMLAFLGAMAGHAVRFGTFIRIAVLDSLFVHSHANNVNVNIKNFLFVYPESPELILCPLNVMNGNHWTLLAIHVLLGHADYYDTLESAATSGEIYADELALCTSIIEELKAAEIIDHHMVPRRADTSTFDFQRDGFNCGPHKLLIAENLAFHGYSMKFDHRLNIATERYRMQYLLNMLYELNKDKDEWHRTNLDTWLPTAFERQLNQPLPLIDASQLELPAENDLIQHVQASPSSTPQPSVPLRRSQRVIPRTDNTRRLYYEKMISRIKSHLLRLIPVGLNSSEINPDEHYLGPMDKRCLYCLAFLFRCESLSGCCAKGAVPCPDIPPMPARFEQIASFREYWTHPKQFNSLMAMVSTQAKVTRHADAFKIEGELRHNAGDLVPMDGEAPSFAQNYCIDSEQALNNRLSDAVKKLHFKADDAAKNKDLIGLLEAMLRQYHPLADMLKNMREILADEEAKCFAEGTELRKFYLVWESGNDQHTHPGRLNLPTVQGQVFAIYRSIDLDAPPKGLWFGISKDGSNSIRYVPHFDSFADAAAYPLIFVFGQEGWHPNLKKLDPATRFLTAEDVGSDPEFRSDSEAEELDDDDELPISKKYENVSMKQHYTSLLYDRTDEQKNNFNPVTGQKTLSQIFIINGHLNVLRQRLDKLEQIESDPSKQKRYEQCSRLRDALQARIDRDEQLRGKTLGKIVMLNKNFRGGNRYMQEKFKDNIALCNRHGMPSLFVTFTGNPKWREITENLRRGDNNQPAETWIDRPDLICRVFNLKAKQFLEDVLKKNTLGKVKAYSVSLEHQKRGMPHLHMLLIMEADYKYNNPEEVDDLISAQIPIKPDDTDLSYDADYQRRYYDTVMTLMVHDPKRCKAVCGNGKQPGICGKDFPKPYTEETIMRLDGYAQLKRPDDGRAVEVGANGKRRNVPITNQYIIAHNRYLLLKYNSHINIEHCGGIKCIKYLYKYIFKGNDQAFVSVREMKNSTQNNNVVDYNEIVQFRKMRCVGAAEAVESLLSMFTTRCSHSIKEHEVHLEDNHNVVFNPEDTEERLKNLTENSGAETEARAVSRLTAFFNLVNQELAEIAANPNVYTAADLSTRSINLYYHQVNEYYTWDIKNKKWNRRVRDRKVVGRLRTIYPSDVELYCMRELLKHVKGPRNYEAIRTFNGEVFPTYRAAAVARNLYIDDTICYTTMDEITKEFMPRQCRVVFALLLVYNEPADAAALWEKYCDLLIDRNANISKEIRIQRALAHIASILFHHQKTTADFHLPDVSEDDLMDAINDAFPPDSNDGTEDYDNLNTEQRAFVDKVEQALFNPSDRNRERLFFLQGSGGTGKTFVYNTMIRRFRAMGKKVIAVASTGIAAILLDGGTTAHSAFRIPLDIHQEPNIAPNDPLARLIIEADLIIWDESPMQHKSVLQHVATLIRNLVGIDEHHSKFGNKTVVLGGDFKQLLPVMRHETARSSYEASLLCSPLFKENFKIYSLTTNVRAANDPSYSAWLSDVGHGRVQCSFGPSKIQLPDDIVCYDQNSVLNFVYPAKLFDDPKSAEYLEYVSEAVLMAPLNDTVKDLNERIISMLPGDHKEFTSVNIMSNTAYPEDEFLRDNYDAEELSRFEHSSIPTNIIRLKVGSVVMLTRNLDIRLGLCNGTRMVVENMGANYIGCRIITGSSKGQLVPIVAMPNNFSDKSDDSLPEFTRYQLPIRPAFAMTINKSQGQTLSKVGVIFNTPSFSHGQCYVAVSRVRRRQDIKIFVSNENTATVNGKKVPHTTNIVFKEVIAAMNQQVNRQ